MLYGDVGLLRSSARGDAAVAGTQIGARVLGSGHGGRAERALQVGCRRVRVDLTRPADSLLPGQVPAHEAKCPAVGKRVMSAPVSATTLATIKAAIHTVD